MRALPLAALLLLAGCQMPEDPLPVSGRVVSNGRPRAGVKVRLLRNLTAGDACDQLKVIATTDTAADGTFRFDLIRQQATLGVAAGRWLRVEALVPGSASHASYTFQLGPGPLVLPDLPVGDTFDPRTAKPSPRAFDEVLIDGHVAWRTPAGGYAPAFDRPTRRRQVVVQELLVTVDDNALGTTSTVPVTLRVVSPAVDREAATSTAPPTRAMPCPGVDITPCPMTDGRFLPVELPGNVRTLVVDLGEQRKVSELVLYGLRVPFGQPDRLRVEWSLTTTPSWDPFNTVLLGQPPALDSSNCEEPGAFIHANVEVPGFWKPRMIRLSLPGEGDVLAPWSGLQEVVVW